MTQRSSKILLAVLLATSAAGVAVAAAPVAPKAPPAPRHLDTNNDGQIDRNEAKADPRLAEQFDALDKNKDGKLSAQELPRPPRMGGHPGARGERWGGPRGGHAGRGPMGPGMMMGGMDTDGDGRISAAEAKAHFDKLDVNKDGFIDQADHQARAEQRRAQWFAQADTDKDGKLSPAELAAAREKMGRGVDGQRGPRPPMPPAPPKAPAK